MSERKRREQIMLWRNNPTEMEVDKGFEFLTQTQIFLCLYLYNLMVETFDISNLDYLI